MVLSDLGIRRTLAEEALRIGGLYFSHSRAERMLFGALAGRSAEIGLIERLLKQIRGHVGVEPSRNDIASAPKMSRRILYIQFTDPAAYPPLEHSSRLLADRGWQVFFLGTGTRDDLPLRLPAHPGIRVKRFRFVQGGWRQKAQYVLFFFATLYWTWWCRPEWVYASDSLACPVVWLVQKLTGVRVVYHEHDSPELNQSSTWFVRQILAYRGKLALEADLCILPQQERLQRFLKTTGRVKPAYCVWNCPRLDELADVNSGRDEYHAENGHELVVYYHGNIGSALIPRQLVLAASRLKGAVRMRVVGYETLGNIGYTAELIELAAKMRAAEMIEALGSRTRRESFAHRCKGSRGAFIDAEDGPKTSTCSTWWALPTRHLTTWPAACRCW